MKPARPEAPPPAAKRGDGRDGYIVPEAVIAGELAHIPLGVSARRRFGDATWLVLTVIGLTAFCLDVAGGKGPFDHRLEDGLHLFSSGFPGRPAPGTPVAVEIAQQLAPLVVLFLTLKLVTTVFRRQLNQYRARLRRGHAVVCGLDDKSLRIAEGFLEAGRKVTCVAKEGPQDLVDHLRRRGAIVIDGDPTQERTVRAAAAERARYVVCSSELDRDNATTAAIVARLARPSRGESIEIFVHIGELELASLLRSATFGRAHARVQFFDLNTIWAHELLRAAPAFGGMASPSSPPPQIVVVGTTPLAQSLVLEAARHWHDRSAPDAARLRLRLVGPDAPGVCALLVRRYPCLERRSQLIADERSIEVGIANEFVGLFDSPDARRDALYLCLADEGDNLGLAMQARREFEGEGPALLVPATAWTFQLRTLLGEAADRITPVFYSSRPRSLDLLHDSALESIARAVHASYVDSRRGEADFGERPADVPWHSLAPRYREATRRNVDELVSQLNALWYEIAPRYDWDEPLVSFSAEEVDVLARLEHERWYRERVAEGWVYGTVRDESSTPRRSPRLVGWDALPDEAKSINRVLARERPAILARAGFRLVRSADRVQLARLLHERLLSTRTTAGAVPTAWEELDGDARSLNLSAVDSIAGELLELGYRMIEGAKSHPLVLGQDDLERLAEEEHERWARARLAQGWRPGAQRDDAQRVHPDLVPWAELGEAERDVDRARIALLPELLAAARRGVVRLAVR